ncbi:Small glutamine-rich tetratricopeptide repeat-containing protein beta [Orchesella cincta]|uniref:Small glutamine-rich tetratricopeptide repeat-containing protein beta n=1 Tax=Orchesella cincta TaxID=48709 RepID=A0A1D2MJT9_ORCCI|nr:Small glutamine-rich tetratricopeptide repeat-containing protein beta [Orchesella cincta]
MDKQLSKPVASKGFMELLVEENIKAFESSPELGPEVAIQCLEKVFEKLVVNQAGGDVPGSASGIGSIHWEMMQWSSPGEASDGDKAAAEVLKTKGNDAMARSKAMKGLDCYTKAIALDGNNPVYFCNRSAAYIKLEKFEEARRDCQIAIQLQPSYAKAYGRMGLAYSSQNKHVDAILCYRSALELDPENETYTKNLKVAQQMMVQDIPSATAQATVSPNLEGLLRNQNLVNAASQMLQDPNVMQLMQNLMRGNQGGDAGGGGAGGMESLVQIGQAIAQRFGNSNGNLLDQLAGLGASVGRGANQPANGQPENEDSSGEDRGSN